jgi:ribosomal-protein-alanine N-acetyltransferase
MGELYTMIRRAQEGDAESLEALDGELFPDLCWNANTIKREIKLGWALVAVDPKGRVVGYLIARLDGGMADIIRVGVTKKQQRKGYGRALLKEAVDKISGPMMLTVKRDNAGALKIYKEAGFRASSMVGEDALILVLDQE